MNSTKITMTIALIWQHGLEKEKEKDQKENQEKEKANSTSLTSQEKAKERGRTKRASFPKLENLVNNQGLLTKQLHQDQMRQTNGQNMMSMGTSGQLQMVCPTRLPVSKPPLQAGMEMLIMAITQIPLGGKTPKQDGVLSQSLSMKRLHPHRKHI